METLTPVAPAAVTVAEWQEFLSLDGLCRKAGCPRSELPAIALKEIIDNSFDYEGAKFERDGDAYVISDEGPGLSREQIEKLFCIRRPMTSTKRWRCAGRGALGNGLRVACGVVRALDGEITVASHDGTFRLIFDDVGRTSAESVGPARHTGTEICVRFPDHGISNFEHVLMASSLVPGPIYTGPANPHWFGMMDFRELSRLCDGMTIARFAEQFGIEDKREIPLAEIDDQGIKKLHIRLKNKSPKRIELLGMGADVFPDRHYFAKAGKVAFAGGEMPATVEAWITASRQGSAGADVMALFMNRTWSLSRPSGAFNDNITLHGCALNWLEAKACRANYKIALAISAPHFPMTSDGKAPDLSPFAELIPHVVWKAARKAYDAADRPPSILRVQKRSIKEATFEVLNDAVMHASSSGSHDVTARQVYYAVRDRLTRLYELGIKDSYFTQNLLPEYREAQDVSHWPEIIYDSRGTASEPHDGEKKIPLSTRDVIEFTEGERFRENFGAVLYIEKEQFGAILDPVAREFDLLLVEAKGQATIAERKLLAWADEHKLPVFVFADLDVAGLQICESLRTGSRRHPGGISVTRVGLNLDQVREYDLLPEPYIPNPRQIAWLNKSGIDQVTRDFVLHRRCELNHLTSGQMIELLRRGLATAGVEKVLPEKATIRDRVMYRARDSAERTILERSRSEIDQFVKAAASASIEEIERDMRMRLREAPLKSWRSALNDTITETGITVYRGELEDNEPEGRDDNPLNSETQ